MRSTKYTRDESIHCLGSKISFKEECYKYFTKFDLSMMLYSFKLDEESKTLYTIITPFGKYQYNRLPMRIEVAPDIAQEKIEETPCGIDCELFIKDIGIFFEQLVEHMATLITVIQCLNVAGFAMQPPSKIKQLCSLLARASLFGRTFIKERIRE